MSASNISSVTDASRFPNNRTAKWHYNMQARCTGVIGCKKPTTSPHALLGSWHYSHMDRTTPPKRTAGEVYVFTPCVLSAVNVCPWVLLWWRHELEHLPLNTSPRVQSNVNRHTRAQGTIYAIELLIRRLWIPCILTRRSWTMEYRDIWCSKHKNLLCYLL